MFVANCIGFGRLAAAWNMVEELPQGYQDQAAGPGAPWTQEAVVVRG